MKKLSIIVIFFIFSSIANAQINKEKIDQTLLSKGIDLKSNGYVITSQYTSKSNGVTHVYMRQTLNEIEIFNANSALHFDKIGNIINFNNSFINNASSILVNSKNEITYSQAITTVAMQLGKIVIFSFSKSKNTSNEFSVTDVHASSKEIKAKKYFLL
jgi:Zn-dependent metalloprotease